MISRIFDQLVVGLDSFETVRYPNDYIKRGAGVFD